MSTRCVVLMGYACRNFSSFRHSTHQLTGVTEELLLTPSTPAGPSPGEFLSTPMVSKWQHKR